MFSQFNHVKVVDWYISVYLHYFRRSGRWREDSIKMALMPWYHMTEVSFLKKSFWQFLLAVFLLSHNLFIFRVSTLVYYLIISKLILIRCCSLIYYKLLEIKANIFILLNTAHFFSWSFFLFLFSTLLSCNLFFANMERVQCTFPYLGYWMLVFAPRNSYADIKTPNMVVLWGPLGDD